ncbi:hypothetical protein C5167_025632 [Papaver somniferum]|uniref:Uncharacterized protein n=1 Tax=Papaver somniferum TaxID=3469 RepID=A0A4Y7JS05_PAPSO|nr:hypothetical protein C5167_025632 [Papaver somniferum]
MTSPCETLDEDTTPHEVNEEVDATTTSAATTTTNDCNTFLNNFYGPEAKADVEFKTTGANSTLNLELCIRRDANNRCVINSQVKEKAGAMYSGYQGV